MAKSDKTHSFTPNFVEISAKLTEIFLNLTTIRVEIEPLSIIFLQIHPATLDWVKILINFFVFLLFIGVSFFASSSEVAFFSLSEIEIQELKSEDSPLSKKVTWMLQHHKQLIATVLITNNFVNIFAILIGTYIIRQFSDYYQLSHWQEIALDLSVMSMLLLLGGEIIPKVYASRFKMSIIRVFYQPLFGLMKIYSPLTNLLIKTTKFVDSRFQPKQESASIDDLREAIDLMPEAQQGENNGRELLRGILNIRNITVRNVIKERTQVAAVDYDLPFQDLVEFVREHAFSRMPVYVENLDQIKGVLHIKDLLPLLEQSNKNPAWQHLIRPAIFVFESRSIDKLLEEMKEKRSHLVIAVDEYGGTAGIVTLEDIIDEIFGEIKDEFDEDELGFQVLGDSLYRMAGSTRLNDMIRLLDLDEDVFQTVREEENISSLGGLILFIAGKFPEIGTVLACKITDPNFEFTVESVEQNKIQSVLVKILPANK